MEGIIESLYSWDLYSVAVYLSGVLIPTFFMNLYSRYKKSKPSFSGICLLFSILYLCFLLGFSDCGTDYYSYKKIFENSLNFDYLRTSRIEYGYLLLNIIVRLFTNNFYIFRFICAAIFVLLVFKGILSFNNINCTLAIFAFTSIYMYQSMSLIRIYISMGIVFSAFIYYYNGNYQKYFLYILVAFLFHRSAIVALVPLLLSLFIPSRLNVWLKLILLCFLLVFIYIFKGTIISFISFNNSYSLVENSKIGVMFIVYHIPILIVLILFKRIITVELYHRLIWYFMGSLMLGFISYLVTTLGRANIFYSPLYIIVPSIYLNFKNRFIYRYKMNISKKRVIASIYVIFLIFRAVMSTEYFYTDNIIPYSNILHNTKLN